MSIATSPSRCAVRVSQRASAMLPWWLGLVAITWAWIRPPTSARSPRMSAALWRTNSSGQRSARVADQPVVGQHQRGVERRAERQPAGAERLRLAQEAERARPGQLAGELLRRDVVGAALAADQRVGPLDRGREPERAGRGHHVARVALGELKRRGHAVDHRLARPSPSTPGLASASRNGVNDPSPIGGSGPSSSTVRSSSSSAAAAASRCSTVCTAALALAQRRAPLGGLHLGDRAPGSSGAPGRSTRRNTIPCPGGAGRAARRDLAAGVQARRRVHHARCPPASA